MRHPSSNSPALVIGGVAVLAAAGWALAPRAQAAQAQQRRANLTQGFAKGTWDHKSIGPLAFGGGVLFFADDQAGAIYGVDLGEQRSQAAAPASKVADLGATIAAKMGTTVAGIQIRDMAVSQASKNIYISVRKIDGADQNAANPANYALFSVAPDGKVSAVDLTDKPFGKVSIAGEAAFGRRGSSDTRKIADIAYAPGRILVSAISTEEFKSNLVSVPLPFNQAGVSRFATSIYHISHKRQETASPIQTLTIYRDGDKRYLMAAYVCTPVVRFNLDDLKPGATVTGATVAELGSMNQPTNMIAYGPAASQSLLLNNSSFGPLKVDGTIAKETAAVNEMAKADRGSAGKTPFPGIEPVANLKGASLYAASGNQVIVIKTGPDGVSLEAMPAP